MKTIDFSNNKKKIFFSGIGGISMSGLAQILKSRGFDVCGSDIKDSELIENLRNMGIKVTIGQVSSNITSDIDLLVNTAAVKKDSEELVMAEKLNIPIISRAELLGQIMKNYSHALNIAGTHGKTTTTSMISHIYMESNLDPTISVGGILDLIDGNIRVGKSDYFITEACEYCDSFLSFYPTVGIILNIEEDHLDYFKDINDIRKSFKKFASLIDNNGALIINAEIDNLEEITDGLKCSVYTFGIEKGLFTAKNISYDEKGLASFDVYFKNEFICHISLGVPGKHNIYNCLASIATSYFEKIPVENIVNGLKKFSGAHRRFELKGKVNGLTVVDDYAHHPTEIKATLSVCNNYKYNKLWCVFQPHTYSRTKSLFDDFSNAFTNVDNLIIADIYAAREKDNLGISSKDLVDKINKEHKCKNAMYIGSFSEIEKYILDNYSQGDLLITMGAGDVYLIGDSIVNK